MTDAGSPFGPAVPDSASQAFACSQGDLRVRQSPQQFSVCLITALTIADFVDLTATVSARQNVGAQIGVFTLAAVLRQHGYAVDVVNLDEYFLDYLKPEMGGPTSGLTESETVEPTSLLAFVLKRLSTFSPDVFGLSSICSSYPLTLRLARELKKLNPDVPVVLGGPQASVVDVATMNAFLYVDAVVRGEADESLPIVLDRLRRRASLDNIAGVTFRRGHDVVRNPNGPVVEDLDRVPLPAFDLDAKLKDRDGIHLEIGRGCPFACTFCSTNDFFRRNFRLKSTGQTIAEMRSIKQQYGITYFSMIHDMYTVNRKKVVEFCDALLACGEEYTWGCSARTDCIDDELIGLMAKAGCHGIFFGIETGSARLQKEINKKLDLEEAWARIKCGDANGVQMAVALITGFPDETRDDLRDTIHFFIESLRYDHAEPQLSLLAPLAATPIYENHKAALVFDDIFSDMSHQGWRQDREDLELIKLHPDVFPNFYAVPMKWLDRSYVKDVHDFITYLATWFRWLPVGILQDSGDLLEVFDDWKQWLADRRASRPAPDTGIAPYYTHREFRREFIEFVRTWYCDHRAAAPAAVMALADAEGWGTATRKAPPPKEVEEVDELDTGAFAYLRKPTTIIKVGVDYKQLVAALRSKRNLSQVPIRDITLAFRAAAAGRVDVWQISPLSGALLDKCDGTRSVEQIAAEFADAHPGVDGIPPAKVAMFGLVLLQRQGFIGLSRNVLQQTAGPDEASEVVGRFVPPPQLSANQQPWPVPATAA